MAKPQTLLPERWYLRPDELEQLLAPAIGAAAASTLYHHLRVADRFLLHRTADWVLEARRPGAEARPPGARLQEACRQEAGQ